MEFTAEQIKKMSYDEQFTHKKELLRDMMSTFPDHEHASFSTYKSAEKNYRMRAEFRIWHEGTDSFHIMFDQKTKQKYRVDSLNSACLLINNAMQSTIQFIKNSPLLRQKLFQIDYLASSTNELVISLLYHKQLEDSWEIEAQALATSLKHLGRINIIGRAKKQKRVVGVDFVIESVKIKNKKYSFKQIENSFTQPNAQINEKMIEWVIEKAANEDRDLLELYCGAGNFSIPLSHYFRSVLATEISKTSVNAAQDNISDNSVKNLKIARLSSEEFVQAFNRERAFNRLAGIILDDYDFSTVLVDPPRAGCDPTTLKLMSAFDTIVYISCNPATLIDNIRELSSTHRINDFAFFDQFPFTPHMESGVVLVKK